MEGSKKEGEQRTVKKKSLMNGRGVIREVRRGVCGMGKMSHSYPKQYLCAVSRPAASRKYHGEVDDNVSDYYVEELQTAAES